MYVYLYITLKNTYRYYATCPVAEEGDKYECIYSQGLHTLDVDIQLCQDMFEGIFDSDQKQMNSKGNLQDITKIVDDHVTLSNAYFGGNHPGASRIMFPNGDIDPWKALGVGVDIFSPNGLAPHDSEDLPTLMVDGASHHFWTHPSLPTDAPEIREARSVIWYQVDTWLNLPSEIF